ncbi:hypothetical protein P7K49_034067 [Saguinus oedipus]|uniref:Asc-type amino acid transporter 1 n=1 Tax=Saguinus oedipus TaxID=9490 RepID=A0ABQ9TTP9_SAGOE|nr:hypothetical protein P7K49_034067 [Saguinus oedipus]
MSQKPSRDCCVEQGAGDPEVAGIPNEAVLSLESWPGATATPSLGADRAPETGQTHSLEHRALPYLGRDPGRRGIHHSPPQPQLGKAQSLHPIGLPQGDHSSESPIFSHRTLLEPGLKLRDLGTGTPAQETACVQGAVLIMYPTSLAVISMTFSNYVLQPVFPNCIPPAAASRTLSMACLMLLTWVNSSSVRWATRIQDVFTGGKLLALSLIIGVGLLQIFQGHFEELRPSNAFAFWMTPSVGHLALAFLQGSFAFSGWNFLNYVTEEMVDARKNLPRAIFISIPLVTFVYTFTNIAYFTAMSPQELLSSNAVAVTFGEKLLGYFSWVMPVSVALSTFGGINGYLFTSSRLCFSGAREGHLPSLLAMIHVRRCTPIPALLVCCGATAVIMLVGDTYTLINYVSFINYLCYGVTILGLLLLRWRRPGLHRPIKVNLLIPVAYLVFWAFLLVFSFVSEPMVCGVGVIIILTGVPIFFLGVFWRSKPKCVHRLTGEPGSRRSRGTGGSQVSQAAAGHVAQGAHRGPGPGDRNSFLEACPELGVVAAEVGTQGPVAAKWPSPRCTPFPEPTPLPNGSCPELGVAPNPQGQGPRSICLSSESMTRWGQELCFVVYPQDAPEEEENGPCPPSPLPATDKPLKPQ